MAFDGRQKFFRRRRRRMRRRKVVFYWSNIIGANMDLIPFCTKNIEGILDDNKNVMMIKNYNRAYHITTVIEIFNFGN